VRCAHIIDINTPRSLTGLRDSFRPILSHIRGRYREIIGSVGGA
jgi:hypothetical protein